GGFGLFTAHLSSGKALLWLLLGLGLSGVFWRLAYRVVPPRAAPLVGNYSQEGSAGRAALPLTEIEKIAAGKSADFQLLKAWVLATDRGLAEVQHAAVRLSPKEQAAIVELHTLAASRSRALFRLRLQAYYERLLQVWRYAHVPLTFAFLVALV